MAIDRKRIVESLSRVTVSGNDEGLIEAFGVFVNQLPADFWNSFAERLVRQVSDDLRETAEQLLVNAAHECGYHTGHGIISSDEWRAVVEPMVEGTPDVLHGAFAVLAAWGWAKADIVELEPNQRMVVRAYDYYESDIVRYGAVRRPRAYMMRGIAAAFMDLAYAGPYDPTGATGLRTFGCTQIKGIECGDDYGEFLVRRAA